ncbi:MAG: dipeptide ABC transporter ATP-binding protein [Deltaproteobacteria bacterium]|nr:dipeptide ABC transporter ATP-binding protein [Deltaproteobacteria bacterium]
MTTPLLQTKDLKTHYPIRGGLLGRTRGVVKALDGVSLDVFPGETLGVVGESGCGKSTLGGTILKLNESTSGRILFDDKDITSLDERAMRPLRRQMQIIFQDPYASLNPRRTVGQLIHEALEIHGLHAGAGRGRRVLELMEKVGLSQDAEHRFPHEFSGGQRQRIGIARALAVEPSFIVCDEPVSALDVSVQAQVINLLQDLQEELGLSYLFIAHDLAVVEHICHRIAVMYLGRVVEIGTKEEVMQQPQHPYTRALLASIPRAKSGQRRQKKREVLQGELPSPASPPRGCAFNPRCTLAEARCREESPKLRLLSNGTQSACHLLEPDAVTPNLKTS